MSQSPPHKRQKYSESKSESKSESESEISSTVEDEEYEYEEIQREINSIDDLIELGEIYRNRGKRKRYNIDVRALSRLVRPLKRLKAMVGMNTVKETIVNLIVYYMQKFEDANSNMLHTVIEGPPGCGKTTVARIIADIYLQLGIVGSDTFIVARRSDLIGKYLGSTTIKTQNVIDAAYNGVLFIDEGYALGNSEKRDSFSKECIDTINQNLTEGKCNFICIIAGYKENLKSCFFAYNPGLERRFPFRYTIDPYGPSDLREIYINMVKEAGWSLAPGIPPLQFFEKNTKYFKFSGGDMETLLQMTKIAHSKRVFCLDQQYKKIITEEDLTNALKFLLRNEEVRQRNGHENQPPWGMYL